MPKAPKGTDAAADRIKTTESHQTSDGRLFPNYDLAHLHQRVLNVNEKLAHMLKAGVKSITWGDTDPGEYELMEGLQDRGLVITFKDGRSIVAMGAGGDETTHTDITIHSPTDKRGGVHVEEA